MKTSPTIDPVGINDKLKKKKKSTVTNLRPNNHHSQSQVINISNCSTIKFFELYAIFYELEDKYGIQYSEASFEFILAL